jgi:hypothetical protein
MSSHLSLLSSHDFIGVISFQKQHHGSDCLVILSASSQVFPEVNVLLHDININHLVYHFSLVIDLYFGGV